jgi:replicative DNA helicase
MSALENGLNVLTEDCFYNTANRYIFVCMMDMQQNDVPVDFITLIAKLQERGSIDAVGGSPYIAELANNVATAENIEHHAHILIDKRNRRKGIEVACKINEAAYDEENPFLEQQESILADNAMISSDRRARIVKVSDLRGGMVEYYDRKQIKKTYNSGWVNLNRHYRLSTGSLNIWTGIPGSGKSEVFDAVMINAALRNGWRWLIFSPENYPYEIHVQKLAEKITRKGLFSKKDRMQPAELEDAMSFLEERFFFIDASNCEFTTDGILNFIKRNTAIHGNIQGVLIDPFNELEIVKLKNENTTDTIGRFLRRARWVARKNDFSLHVIAHPTKLEKDRKTHKYPVARPYDIDGSAHWFNKSDNCFSIYREYKTNIVQLHIQKIKFKWQGYVGMIQLQYDPVSGVLTEYYDSETPDEGIGEELAVQEEVVW